MKQPINPRLGYLVLLSFCACANSNTNTKISDSAAAKNSQANHSALINAPRDTTVFELTKEKYQMLSTLNDAGILDVSSKKLRIKLLEKDETTYDLIIEKSNQVIYTAKSIQGISKVYYNDTFLMLTKFSLFTEDGSNEGEPIYINLKDNTVKESGIKATNTCNPIIVENEIFFINGLKLIKTDLNFKIVGNLQIQYSTSSTDYLDTYLICGLSQKRIQNTDQLVIEFASDKKNPCKAFAGLTNQNEGLVLLKP